MSLLTEQEITEIVREAARGSATRRDGSTSQRIARVVEAKARANLIEEIKAQGTVAWLFNTNIKALLPEEVDAEQFAKWPHLYKPLYLLLEGD